MPSKVGQLQTIPVVVQSLPVVYTTVPTDGVATAAITVPLIGSDGRSEGSGEGCTPEGQVGGSTDNLCRLLTGDRPARAKFVAVVGRQWQMSAGRASPKLIPHISD